MSVASTDLVVYGSATMPEDDTTTNVGGAIATNIKMEMAADITVTGLIEGVSLGGNSQTLDVAYRTAAGVAGTELQSLDGATAVAFAASMERILKMTLSRSAGSLVTVRKTSAGTTLGTLPIGVKEIRRPFYLAVAPDSGTKSYYEKVFYHNLHQTLALTSASIYESADPTGNVTFALDGVAAACALNLNVSSGASVRTSPPGGRITSFDGASKGIRANNNLQPASAQGVWLRLLLSNTDAATKTSYTIGAKGSST